MPVDDRIIENGKVILLPENPTKEETDEFINIFTVFYKRIKERISNYENSLNIGRIKNMEILIGNVKSIVANIKSGVFEQYKNVSFNDAAKNITELYVKDVKNG